MEALTTPEEIRTRFLGCCQICEQEQKLTPDGKLVHHGYRRPGDGAIVGDCYGVHAVPYEVSCEILKKYLGGVRQHLASAEESLAKWRKGEVTYFTETHRGMRGTAIVDHYALGVTEYWRFTGEVKHRIRMAESEVGMIESHVKRLERRVAEWAPAPIRTIEEKAAAEKAVKEAREAERAAAREAREDKVNATKAKQAALAAKRQAIMDGFAVKFVALAAQPESPERTVAAQNLAFETTKKKYNFFYTRELKCDETLIALGLAKRDTQNPEWVRYDYPLC